MCKWNKVVCDWLFITDYFTWRKEATVKFTIVDKLFPNVIIGMNTMMRYNISVSPGHKHVSVSLKFYLLLVKNHVR